VTDNEEDNMRELISRAGARIGNWNDRRFPYASENADTYRRWKRVDRIVSWLYTLPDRRRGDGLFRKIGAA